MGINSKYGYVYAVEYDDGIIKVGMTVDFSKRIRSLKHYRGDGHLIIKTFVSDCVRNPAKCEKNVQSKLNPFREGNVTELYESEFEKAIKDIFDETDCEFGEYTGCRQSTVKKYPCLDTYEEAFARVCDMAKKFALYTTMDGQNIAYSAPRCIECGEFLEGAPNYCPNCGSKMDWKQLEDMKRAQIEIIRG